MDEYFGILLCVCVMLFVKCSVVVKWTVPGAVQKEIQNNITQSSGVDVKEL